MSLHAVVIVIVISSPKMRPPVNPSALLRDLDSDKHLCEALVVFVQAEVYKTDFEAERKAREKMAAERDRLKEETEQLQQRNQQLLTEMQDMSTTQVSELQRRHGYMAYTQVRTAHVSRITGRILQK